MVVPLRSAALVGLVMVVAVEVMLEPEGIDGEVVVADAEGREWERGGLDMVDMASVRIGECVEREEGERRVCRCVL